MSRTTASYTPDTARQRLYELMNDETLSLGEKQEHALDLGCAYLGVENGHIERVRADEQTHEVVASAGESPELAPEGAVLDRATTFCRRTLERESPLALSDAPNQGFDDDPAYLEHGVECYFGTTVFVDGQKYGTVCFVSPDSRGDTFDTAERTFIELLARLLGREIESEQYTSTVNRVESKYQALVETAPDAIFLVRQATGDIVEANAAAADLVGYDREDLIGLNYSDLHASTADGEFETLLADLVELGETRTRLPDGSQLSVHHRDGTEIPVEVAANTVELDGETYIHGVVRDITDRRERQAELRVKNRAMDEASVGITIADATETDLPLVYTNDAFTDLTGYTSDSALGANCRFLQGPDTDAQTTAAIGAAIRNEEPITTELINYRADGTPFWNELTVTPVTDEQETVSHYVGIQRDVTERKRREQLISVLNRVLRHNLRNDMNAVKGYAEIVADRTAGETAEFAARIAQTARDLTDLSEKARTAQQTVRNPGTGRERDVVGPVDRTAQRLRDEFPDAAITVETPEELFAMSTERLEDAVYELGTNAAKHGGEQPTVKLGVEPRPEEGTVAVTVADDGPGLPAQERRILETGEETPLDHSSGIGLWMVNWITRGVGGDVQTTVEDGTTVTLSLPVTDNGDATAVVHTD